MIQLTAADKRFGHKLLFENLNWLITPSDHIGLVAGNGTGKSTLLKIIGGMDHFDNGSLTLAKGLTTGYLPQDGLSLSGRTVFHECITVFDDVKDMEIELGELTGKMSDLDPTSPEYVAQYSHAAQSKHRRIGRFSSTVVGGFMRTPLQG